MSLSQRRKPRPRRRPGPRRRPSRRASPRGTQTSPWPEAAAPPRAPEGGPAHTGQHWAFGVVSWVFAPSLSRLDALRHAAAGHAPQTKGTAKPDRLLAEPLDLLLVNAGEDTDTGDGVLRARIRRGAEAKLDGS